MSKCKWPKYAKNKFRFLQGIKVEALKKVDMFMAFGVLMWLLV